MRSSLFILSMSLLTITGWGLHSRLESFTDKTIIDLSSINKSIKVIHSLSDMPLKETPSIVQYDYLKTDERISKLSEQLKKLTTIKDEQNFKPTKVAKKNVTKLHYHEMKEVQEIELAIDVQSNNKRIEESLTLDEKDSFEFKIDRNETSEFYAFNNYGSHKAFTYIALEEKSENLEDQVKLAQAAPEKTEEIKNQNLSQKETEVQKVDEITNKDNVQTQMPKLASADTSDDDIKTFEYPLPENQDEYPVKKTTELIEKNEVDANSSAQIKKELPIQTVVSSNVSQAIRREMNSSSGPFKSDKSFEDYADESLVASNKEIKQPEYSKATSSLNSLTKTQSSKILSVNTQLVIHASSFSLQNGVEDQIKDFDVQSSVEVNDVKSSVNSEIKYEMILDQKKNFKSFVISSQDHIKTNINLETLVNEENESVVPLLNALSLEELLIKRKVEGDGGLLLVKLSPEILGMNLDKKAQLQLPLNDNLKIIKDETKAAYVLYVGIDPGNVMVSIKTEDGFSNYLTNVNANELTYDAQPFTKKEKIKIELFNEELMSRNTTPLNLMNEDLVSFGSGKSASKLTLNSYEFNDELIKTDNQNYFEIKKGEMDLFFGFKNNSKIVIPSPSYQDEIMKILEIDKPDKACIIQINIKDSKHLNSIRSLAYTTDGLESLTMTALDKDGSFGDDISDTTSKVFFKGNSQGSLKLEMKYIDDSEETLQTFCSQGVYLVEQL
jgi:hypothetical protein